MLSSSSSAGTDSGDEPTGADIDTAAFKSLLSGRSRVSARRKKAYFGALQYHDVPFTVLFGVNVVAILALSAYYGSSALIESADHPETMYVSSLSDGTQQITNQGNYDNPVAVASGIFLVSILACGASVAWMYVMSYFAGQIITAIAIGCLAVVVIIGIVLIASGCDSTRAQGQQTNTRPQSPSISLTK